MTMLEKKQPSVNPEKSYISATFNSVTGDFVSDFAGNGSTLSTLLGGCLASIAKDMGSGDLEQSRIFLFKLSRESVKFALGALDAVEKSGKGGGEVAP